MVLDSKHNLRSQVRQLVHTSHAESSVEKNIIDWTQYKSARKIAFYFAMKGELNLDFLFESGKELFLPRYNKVAKAYEMCLVQCEEELQSGEYGIKEPGMQCRTALKNEIELWFIPGMAFSRSGHRLGRGAGFYDRLLEDENGLKTGVCTAQRILEYIPLENHDIKMDFVLTDKEIITIN